MNREPSPAAQRVYTHIGALEARARQRKPIPVAVAYPCDADSLGAALEAAKTGFIVPTLVGPQARIRAVATELQVELGSATLVDTTDSGEAAARRAVELASQGAVQALMKGCLSTDAILSAVLGRDAGLRTDRRLSHVFLLDIPGRETPLLLTDAVINVTPTLADKRDIVQNAIDLAHKLDLPCPRVAIVCAVEKVNPAMPSTVEAAALCKMAQRQQITGALLDGPLGFDNAVSLAAARTKKIESEVAGHADVIVVPNLEAGNILYKSLVYLAHSECAGIVLGAKVPVILTSRAESRCSRVASCALAVLGSG
jgi:phosphate acetyltransferase